MKTSLPRAFALTAALLGLMTSGLHAVDPNLPTPPPLAEALKLKGGKIVVLQPLQMKRGQTLLVTHTKFADGSVRPGYRKVVMLAIYSTDEGDEGKLLFSDASVIAGAGAGAGPHVKVFNGYTPSVDVEQQGIIAILIGLLLPAVTPSTVQPMAIPLPGADAISAELHDSNALIGLLLPAVQKVREAAAR